jgi:hypothetical protein
VWLRADRDSGLSLPSPGQFCRVVHRSSFLRGRALISGPDNEEPSAEAEGSCWLSRSPAPEHPPAPGWRRGSGLTDKQVPDSEAAWGPAVSGIKVLPDQYNQRSDPGGHTRDQGAAASEWPDATATRPARADAGPGRTASGPAGQRRPVAAPRPGPFPGGCAVGRSSPRPAGGTRSRCGGPGRTAGDRAPHAVVTLGPARPPG